MGAPKQPPYAPDVNASDVPWHTFVNGATLPGSRGGVTEFGGAVASAGASDVEVPRGVLKRRARAAEAVTGSWPLWPK